MRKLTAGWLKEHGCSNKKTSCSSLNFCRFIWKKAAKCTGMRPSTSSLLPGQVWWGSTGIRNQGLRWVGLRGYPTLWMCPAHVLLLSWELPYCMYRVTARSPGAWLGSSGFAGWSPRIPRLALFSAFKLLSCARSLWLMTDASWFPLQKTWLGAWFVYCALRRLLVSSLVNKLIKQDLPNMHTQTKSSLMLLLLCLPTKALPSSRGLVPEVHRHPLTPDTMEQIWLKHFHWNGF